MSVATPNGIVAALLPLRVVLPIRMHVLHLEKLQT
jgi:hypothetical protein